MKNTKARDLSGQTFGNWTALSRAENRYEIRVYYACRCICGTIREIASQTLTSGKSTSCGCTRGASYTLAGHTKKGQEPPGYCTWVSMRGRCNNPNTTHYARYGGRGITVGREWNSSFAAFIRDMGEPPTANHTIERLDNDGHYCKSNCKWATRKEQAGNRTHNIKWERRIRDQTGRFT